MPSTTLFMPVKYYPIRTQQTRARNSRTSDWQIPYAARQTKQDVSSQAEVAHRLCRNEGTTANNTAAHHPFLTLSGSFPLLKASQTGPGQIASELVAPHVLYPSSSPYFRYHSYYGVSTHQAGKVGGTNTWNLAEMGIAQRGSHVDWICRGPRRSCRSPGG